MRGMTSYAWVQKRKGEVFLDLALRSVNSKYLEIITHQLPAEKLFLEETVKREVSKKIKRGRIELYFFLRTGLRQSLCVNQHILHQYHKSIRTIAKTLHLKPVYSVEQLLSLPGIVSLKEQSALDNKLFLSAIRTGVQKLVQFKKQEGNIIKKEIIKNLLKIKGNIRVIRRIKKPAATSGGPDKDIDEEISLILFYINKLEKLLSIRKEEPVGKTVDFLTQEILRELNAASSKTKGKTISWKLIETKSYLERIREQAQNIE